MTSTLGQESNDLLPTIYAILLADVWLSPLLRMSDWLTNIKKHILAPRARTQEEMNLWFQGTYYNIGERYTVSIFICFSNIDWFVVEMKLTEMLYSVRWTIFFTGFYQGAVCRLLLLRVVTGRIFLRRGHFSTPVLY